MTIRIVRAIAPAIMALCLAPGAARADDDPFGDFVSPIGTPGLELGGRRGGVDLGATWETPVTDRKDTFGWRVTPDATVWID